METIRCSRFYALSSILWDVPHHDGSCVQTVIERDHGVRYHDVYVYVAGGLQGAFSRSAKHHILDCFSTGMATHCEVLGSKYSANARVQDCQAQSSPEYPTQ